MFKNTPIKALLMTFILGVSSISILQADTYGSYQGSEISDQDLKQNILDKIGSGWFDKGDDQITVKVNNGVVTLKGSVETQADKDGIEKDVRNIDGVKGLNSQIAVVKTQTQNKQFPQDTFTSALDDQLNQKIRDSVSVGWFNVDYKSISLHTSNGVVTVEGAVDSMKTKKHLLKEIQNVEGVKNVQSKLTIEPN